MKQRIRVWDIPTRIFHWTLVVCIGLMYYTATSGHMQWHLYIGLFLLFLMIFRIIWGFLGSETARFRNFIKGPKAIKNYITGHFSENEQPGHNPLGALMVIALITLVILQIVTGLFSADENSYGVFDGYLKHLISDGAATTIVRIHKNLFWIIIGFACVHVISIFLYAIIKRIDLVLPMITGYKKIEGDTPNLKFASKELLLIVLVVSVSLTYFIWLLSKL